MLVIRKDAVTAAAWVTESQTVRNWKRSKINRPQISDEEITFQILQRITKKKGTNEKKKYFQFVYFIVLHINCLNNFVFCFSEINN